jgi:methionyl-tRNA formyltransferase
LEAVLLDGKTMRIVMLGTGTYAVPLLAGLYESSHDVVAVFTRPERQKNKRWSVPPSPMRARADHEGTPVYAPDDINAESSHVMLRDLQPDLFIVCDYGQILSPQTLSLAPKGGLNLHASLLPKYRGAAPIHWAIYHGELGSRLIVETIDQLARGVLQPSVQDVEEMTRAPKLQKVDGHIDWTRSAQAIHNQIRAMVPWPKSFTHHLTGAGSPLRLIIESSAAFSATMFSQLYSLAPTESPGTVLVAERDCLFIQTGEGVLQVLQLQPAGKKVLSADAFLRGYRIKVGDHLGPLPEPFADR